MVFFFEQIFFMRNVIRLWSCYGQFVNIMVFYGYLLIFPNNLRCKSFKFKNEYFLFTLVVIKTYHNFEIVADHP